MGVKSPTRLIATCLALAAVSAAPAFASAASSLEGLGYWLTEAWVNGAMYGAVIVFGYVIGGAVGAYLGSVASMFLVLFGSLKPAGEIAEMMATHAGRAAWHAAMIQSFGLAMLIPLGLALPAAVLRYAIRRRRLGEAQAVVVCLIGAAIVGLAGAVLGVHADVVGVTAASMAVLTYALTSTGLRRPTRNVTKPAQGPQLANQQMPHLGLGSSSLAPAGDAGPAPRSGPEGGMAMTEPDLRCEWCRAVLPTGIARCPNCNAPVGSAGERAEATQQISAHGGETPHAASGGDPKHPFSTYWLSLDEQVHGPMTREEAVAFIATHPRCLISYGREWRANEQHPHFSAAPAPRAGQGLASARLGTPHTASEVSLHGGQPSRQEPEAEQQPLHQVERARSGSSGLLLLLGALALATAVCIGLAYAIRGLARGRPGESQQAPGHTQAYASRLTALNREAVSLYERGLYEQATAVATEALRVAEEESGLDHPDVADCLNTLGALYKAQGQYAKAEPLLGRSLSILEKVRGPNHLDLTPTLTNLALVCKAQGQFETAELGLRRALEIRERALGANHRDVAVSLNNLAELYRLQRRYDEAEPLYQRALAVFEAAVGANQPDIAGCLTNLGTLYCAQGRYAEAEPLLLRSLSIKEVALGPNHPDVGTTLHGLADLYRNQGRYAEAEPLFKRALSIKETALGPNHPDLVPILNNFAVLCYSQRQYAQTELLLKRSLVISEKALGPDHADVGQGLNNLGVLYFSLGRYSEAEPLYMRSLSIKERALGPNHPEVAQCLENIALLLRQTGRQHDAAQYERRAATVRATTH